MWENVWGIRAVYIVRSDFVHQVILGTKDISAAGGGGEEGRVQGTNGPVLYDKTLDVIKLQHGTTVTRPSFIYEPVTSDVVFETTPLISVILIFKITLDALMHKWSIQSVTYFKACNTKHRRN